MMATTTTQLEGIGVHQELDASSAAAAAATATLVASTETRSSRLPIPETPRAAAVFAAVVAVAAAAALVAVAFFATTTTPTTTTTTTTTTTATASPATLSPTFRTPIKTMLHQACSLIIMHHWMHIANIMDKFKKIYQLHKGYYVVAVPTTLVGLLFYWYNRNKPNLDIRIYNLLPLRATSSLWGKINSYDLPIWMRSKLYDYFCKAYNCDMSEALESDYRHYKNLGEFFGRQLKPDRRPISQTPGVVSPADGLLIHFGPLKNDRIDNVKGINYSIGSFLGLDKEHSELLENPRQNELYNCIIYLAPGDYHRFHSPTEWTVEYRKHFPGRLLSVKPSLLKRVPEILQINERVCYFGKWRHGFFSMTAVGATNVGSIKVYFDDDLQTNQRLLWRPDRYACSEKKFELGHTVKAGQDFGEFNFGSTVVLIFEAPAGCSLLEDQSKVKFGQLLAEIV